MSALTSILFLVLLWKTSEALQYTAEGCFVVDFKAVQKYMNERTETDPAVRKQKAREEIIKDIDYYLTELNKLSATLAQSGLDIEIRKKELNILDTNVFSPAIIFAGSLVDEETALTTFDTWLANNTVICDFVILFTGFNLRGIISGYAHSGTICSTSGTAVVELDATYRVVHTSAQMIAMIMGANHDGIASTKVMSQVIAPSNKNRWTFADCTGTDIIEFINAINLTCLNTTSASSTKPSVTPDSYTGKLLDPETVCKRETNSSTSYMCKNSIYNGQYPKGDNVCSYYYCYLPGSAGICIQAYSSDGIICDVKKRCLKGTCQISDSSATRNVDGSCLWGDQTRLNFTNPTFIGDCNGFIQGYGVISCYNSVVYHHCCSTCKARISGVQGCEWGDKNTDCTKYTREEICTSANNRNICCNHCKNFVGKRSVNNFTPVAIKSRIPEYSVIETKLIDKGRVIGVSRP